MKCGDNVRQAENGGRSPLWRRTLGKYAESKWKSRREQNLGRIWGNPWRTWGLVYGEGECTPPPQSGRAEWQ